MSVLIGIPGEAARAARVGEVFVYDNFVRTNVSYPILDPFLVPVLDPILDLILDWLSVAPTVHLEPQPSPLTRQNSLLA